MFLSPSRIVAETPQKSETFLLQSTSSLPPLPVPGGPHKAFCTIWGEGNTDKGCGRLWALSPFEGRECGRALPGGTAHGGHGSHIALLAAPGDESLQVGVLRQWQLTLYGSVWSPVDIRDRQRWVRPRMLEGKRGQSIPLHLELWAQASSRQSRGPEALLLPCPCYCGAGVWCQGSREGLSGGHLGPCLLHRLLENAMSGKYLHDSFTLPCPPGLSIPEEDGYTITPNTLKVRGNSKLHTGMCCAGYLVPGFPTGVEYHYSYCTSPLLESNACVGGEPEMPWDGSSVAAGLRHQTLTHPLL